MRTKATSMRRHLVPTMFSHFDSGPYDFAMEIQETWAEEVKEQHLKNRAQRLDLLRRMYGEFNIERKASDYAAFGAIRPSLITYHNVFFDQVRSAFVHGQYYPALTAACSLGERILNHLVLDLRALYLETKTSKKVAGAPPFTNWRLMTNALTEWEVLLPDVAKSFHELESLRHRSIHFSKKTYSQTREDALAAIGFLKQIIETQFCTFGRCPWFIEGTLGACFIKKSFEGHPFVRCYLLQFCPLVGINYTYRYDNGDWKLYDFQEYPGAGMTDEEFKQAYNGRNGDGLAPTTEPLSPGIVRHEWSIKNRE